MKISKLIVFGAALVPMYALGWLLVTQGELEMKREKIRMQNASLAAYAYDAERRLK